MKTVRWGVLGVSSHFLKRVITPLLKSPLVEIYGLASRSGQKAEQAARRFGLPAWYPSYEALLEEPAIEAVYIPLPNHLHLEWIRKAARKGKHILCEKPLALNAGEATEAVEEARGRGVLLMEAFMYRLHPTWRRAWELVREGEIGRVQAVHTFYAYTNTDPANIRNRPEAGGGGLMDIGCYAVSSARFIFGCEPRRALSLIRRDAAFGIDSLSSGILDFGEGRALFTVGTQTFPRQEVSIYGSAGRIVFRLPFNIYPDVPVGLRVVTSVGSRELRLGPADQYGLEFEEFSKAVRGGGPAPTPAEDAVANMKVIDALFGSEKSGGWEEV